VSVAATEAVVPDAASSVVGRRAAVSPRGRHAASRTPRTSRQAARARVYQPSHATPARQAQARAAPARRERVQRVRRAVPSQPSSRTNYQPVILVEFVAAILLVALTPFASKKDTQGLSPYAGTDMIKLASLTLAYLILAMISVGGRGPGRIAAWFGGLILLTVGLGEAASIAKVLDIFGTPPATAGEGTIGAAP
jgi:hypothetical protein